MQTQRKEGKTEKCVGKFGYFCCNKRPLLILYRNKIFNLKINGNKPQLQCS